MSNADSQAPPFDVTARTPDDPEPYEVVNDAGDPRFMLICDQVGPGSQVLALPIYFNELSCALPALF